MITREKLECAERSYNKDKYSEKFYTCHLRVLREAQDINESVIKAVRYLFLWKLGKVRSKKTPSSSQLNFCEYYSIPVTKAHEKMIKKAVNKKNLEIAIAFRSGAVTYEKFKSYARNLISSSAIVFPAFYVHIWRPDEYPMIDQKVWKVFLDEKGESVFPHTKPKSWSNFENYIRFFNKLVDDTGLSRRAVDRGLWVLGDLLKVGMKSQKRDKKLVPLDNQKN